jgi:DNA-damage-inducible protein D
MTDERKYDEAFGVDMPFGEALQRFGAVTKEELAETGDAGTDVVTDGQLEIVAFKGKEIRRTLHDGEWMFSVVDVIAAITDSDRARKYWSDLKRQMFEKEGFIELSENIGQLPLQAADGKMRMSDVANTETLFRIIQSISSPGAEPIKRWLAKIGFERIQETQDPELAIKRAILNYQLQGRSDDWIEKRVRSIVSRKELTREWQKRGASEDKDYAMLSNIISEETFGVGPKRHKEMKGLSSQNLRDHMTDLELILTMLGETSSTTITKQRDAQGLYQLGQAAKAGGSIAGGARKLIETETGRKVVTASNFLGSKKREADPVRLTEGGKKAP